MSEKILSILLEMTIVCITTENVITVSKFRLSSTAKESFGHVYWLASLTMLGVFRIHHYANL